MIYDDVVRARGFDPIWEADCSRAARAVLEEQSLWARQAWRHDLTLWGLPLLLVPIVPRDLVILAAH